VARAEKAGWLIVGFLGGILALGNSAWSYAACLLLIAFFVSVKPAVWIFGGCLAGILYTVIFLFCLSEYRVLPRSGYYEATVTSDPKPFSGGFRSEASLAPPNRGDIEILSDRSLDYGSRLRLKGKINTSKPYETPLLRPVSLNLIGREDDNAIRAALRGIKNRFFKPLNKALPERQSSFLKGLLFGDTSAFSTPFRAAMKRSGTTHLVALSGYNIALIAGAVAWMCGKFLSQSGCS
jgi:predicted membrane metal-binding protein